jgi:hypothetical protein
MSAQFSVHAVAPEPSLAGIRQRGRSGHPGGLLPIQGAYAPQIGTDKTKARWMIRTGFGQTIIRKTDAPK